MKAPSWSAANVFAVSLFLVLGAVLSGCATRQLNAVMDSWVGHSASELIGSWGPPQQVLDDGQGGSIFVYALGRALVLPGHSASTGQAFSAGGTALGSAATIYTPPQTLAYTAYRMFWVNNSGVVYKWAWKGY